MTLNLTKVTTTLFLGSLLLLSTAGFAQKENPLSFTENKGQIGDQNFKPRPDVLFYGAAGDGQFLLRNSGISYQLFSVDEWREQKNKFHQMTKIPAMGSIYRLDINWLNANKQAKVITESPLAGYSSFYNQMTPDGVSQVHSYQKVIYKSLYPGIDLHYYAKQGELKYDYVVSPGSDYKLIQLEIEGATDISINRNGAVSIQTPFGTFEEGVPLVYQHGKLLKARWLLNGNTLSFEIENYDRGAEMIIDPLVRNWATFYGGAGEDYIAECATDGEGYSYIVGQTATTSGNIIATVGTHMSSTGAPSWVGGFVAKFDSTGVRQWGTYYGSGGSESANSIAVNQYGQVYFCGNSNTTNGTYIATANAHQPNLYGSYYWCDAYLVKLTNMGTRLWGTFYGGNDDDWGNSISLDTQGNIYMAGTTESTINISTPSCHQLNFGGTPNVNGGDGFLVKFNSLGVRQWGTYYGGGGEDYVGSVNVDASGAVYITGFTGSSNAIITAGTHQTTHAGGVPFYAPWDAFIARFNTSGVRQWGSYYGGSSHDYGYDCQGDGNGNVYLVGVSSSTNNLAIATASAHESVLSNTTISAAYVVKFNSTGQRQWGTFCRGAGHSYGYACAVNEAGDIFIGGQTTSGTGTAIATPDSHQPSYAGGNDAFLVRFDANGLRQEGTYYGGNNQQTISSIVTNSLNQIYCAGSTSTSTGYDVSSPGSHQPNNGGKNDGFLVRFSYCNTAPASPVDDTDHSALLCEPSAATLQINSTGTVKWYAGITSTTVLQTGNNYTTSALNAGTYTWYADAKTCNVTSPRVAVTVTINTCTDLWEITDNEAKVLVYPNPGKGLYIVETNANSSVKIFNVQGQLLTEQNMISGKNTLSLENYPQGIYFVQVNANQLTKTIKLVKE